MQMVHPYVHVSINKQGVKEIWPMILEKAYAKLYGSYQNIDAGIIQDAMADMTNGTPSSYSFEEEECKKMIDSG